MQPIRCLFCNKENLSSVFTCTSCHKILPFAKDINFFTIFNITEEEEPDIHNLNDSLFSLQLKLHPDKFINASSEERELAVENSLKVNEAYQSLKNPIKRTEYLLKLKGFEVTEIKQLIPYDFLMKTFEWGELLETYQNETERSNIFKIIKTNQAEHLNKCKNELLLGNYNNALIELAKVKYLESLLKPFS